VGGGLLVSVREPLDACVGLCDIECVDEREKTSVSDLETLRDALRAWALRLAVNDADASLVLVDDVDSDIVAEEDKDRDRSLVKEYFVVESVMDLLREAETLSE
jgi:hypothetical protein